MTMRKYMDSVRTLLNEFQQHDVEQLLKTGGGDNEPPEPPDDDGDPWGGREEPHYNFHDINDVKRYFRDISGYGSTQLGPAAQEWTVWDYDGAFQRGCFTVDGRPEHFPEMARVMAIWDHLFNSVAVFVRKSRDYGKKVNDKKFYLIALDGKSINPPIEMPEDDSINANPFNDQQWARRLPDILNSVRNQR